MTIVSQLGCKHFKPTFFATRLRIPFRSENTKMALSINNLQKMYRKRKCFYLSTKQKEMQKWQIPILMHCSARTMPHGALRNSSAQEKGGRKSHGTWRVCHIATAAKAASGLEKPAQQSDDHPSPSHHRHFPLADAHVHGTCWWPIVRRNKPTWTLYTHHSWQATGLRLPFVPPRSRERKSFNKWLISLIAHTPSKNNIVTITQQKLSGRERTMKGHVRDENGELLVGVYS